MTRGAARQSLMARARSPAATSLTTTPVTLATSICAGTSRDRRQDARTPATPAAAHIATTSDIAGAYTPDAG